MVGEETVRLRDVCVKIGSGATPRGGKEAYKGGNTSLIRSQNVYNEGFHRDGLVYIDDDQSAELRNVEVNKNDVLLNITGDSVARCCLVAADALPARVNQHVAIIRPDPKALDARFLRYVLVSPEYQSRLLALASAGATRPALTKSMIEELEVPSPPLPEQRAIAHILGTLDDKIELNRKMNETLEEMARAVFKSWFVDFDPVIDNALRAGKPIPPEFQERAERRKAALAKSAKVPTIVKLFPDEFQSLENGWVPKGWSFGCLGDVADVNWGDTKTTKAAYADSGYPAYSAAGNDGLLPYYDHDRTGVVVSAIGANAGTSWLVMGKWSCIKNTIRFWTVSDQVSTEYLFQATLGASRWPLRGSAQPFISQGDSRAMPILIPDGNMAIIFGDTVRTSFRRVFENQIENLTIAALRDTLLPKLLSGEIRVKDAEKFVSEAV